MTVFSKINQALFPGAKEYPKVGAGKMLLLGLQLCRRVTEKRKDAV